MIRAVADLLIFALKAAFSLLRSPNNVADRSLRAAFFCRFLQLLLQASKRQPISWLRQRQQLLAIRSGNQRRVRYEHCEVANVACQWCRQRDRHESTPERVVIYFHGGGYVIGSVQGYRNVLSHLASESDAAVLAVDYRLAPEHEFPAAHEDCFKVAKTVLQDYPGVPVFLAGDSAGGALAVATALALAAESDLPPLAGLAVLSPWIEPANNDSSMRREAPFDILDRALLQRWIDLYLAGGDIRNPSVDFTMRDLSALPPTLLQLCEREILFDQGMTFAEQAKAQGVDLTVSVFPGQFHVFQVMVPLLPGSADALAAIGGFVRAQG